MKPSNHLNPSEYHGLSNYDLTRPGTGLFAVGGYWRGHAWRGYERTPLPTPARGRLVDRLHGALIAEGSGEAMLAVARLYGYGERDFIACLQRYDDPDTWNGYELRRLEWEPREVRRMRSADEIDASDAARVEYDCDGFATLRWSL